MMRSEVQEVCERENSTEMNEFKSIAEIDLEMRALEAKKIKNFLFE